MAVDTPDPGRVAAGSTWEPKAPTPLGAGDGDPPPLEGSSEPSALTQHFPNPSLEESWDGGSSSEDPCMSCSSTLLPSEPNHQAPNMALTFSAHVLQLLRACDKMAAQMEWKAASWSPSLAPSISSVLGKRSPSLPIPTSPPPALGSPVAVALLDWHAWMQHKRAIYQWNNPGKSMPVTVTLLDLHDTASAAATASPFSPLSSLTSDWLRSPSPLSLPSWMSPESEEHTSTLCAVGHLL